MVDDTAPARAARLARLHDHIRNHTDLCRRHDALGRKLLRALAEHDPATNDDLMLALQTYGRTRAQLRRAHKALLDACDTLHASYTTRALLSNVNP